MPLSDRTIRNLEPTERPYKRGDSGGLFLLVTPAGGRWWRFKYRFDGKAKLLSFGTYPDVSLATAREKRDDARRLLAARKDPSAERKAESRAKALRDANSFTAVALEWFEKQAKIWNPRHADDVRRRLERNLFPDLGERAIAEITAPDLLMAARKVESRGAHDLAH
ncbi:MAG TPA: integrase arm-type DNA-binding domain-containing protein, partial [Casimicrobiaceae bacterium]|nr:integrase arm-type DNA-binding domain-containing protein [Casimicrobiaceae bacterium]